LSPRPSFICLEHDKPIEKYSIQVSYEKTTAAYLKQNSKLRESKWNKRQNVKTHYRIQYKAFKRVELEPTGSASTKVKCFATPL